MNIPYIEMKVMSSEYVPKQTYCMNVQLQNSTTRKHVQASDMHLHYTLVPFFLTMLPALMLVNCSVSSPTNLNTREHTSQNFTVQSVTILNIDGDVSLTQQQNRIYWNPHATGLTNRSTWKVTFNDETEIFLKTTSEEAGHVAAGAWWTTSFKSNEKIQLFTSKPASVLASFRANVITAEYASGQEWLRIALACAIQRDDSSVVYTEMDLWDSPSVLACPDGNISSGGSLVYRGGNVVEWKVDQIPFGNWRSYSLELTRYVNSAWLLGPGDVLESVYVVVEAVGETAVTVKIDDLWIARLDWTNA
jgi:hypothetical protein